MSMKFFILNMSYLPRLKRTLMCPFCIQCFTVKAAVTTDLTLFQEILFIPAVTQRMERERKRTHLDRKFSQFFQKENNFTEFCIFLDVQQSQRRSLTSRDPCGDSSGPGTGLWPCRTAYDWSTSERNRPLKKVSNLYLQVCSRYCLDMLKQ